MGQAERRLNTFPQIGSKLNCFLITGNTHVAGHPVEFYDMSKLKGLIYLHTNELHKRVVTLS